MAARIQSRRNTILPVDEASRDDLVLGDQVSVQALDAATTYSWAITFAPEGSTATFSGSTSAVSPGFFTVDVEGPYLIRLIVDAGLATEDTQYVRLRYLTDFGQLSLVAAGERRDGTGIIPVDVDTEGWANEQNANLQTLKTFIKPLVSSGRVFYVDANDGTQNYADYSTIQGAITAAVGEGPTANEQWVVLVRPGTYVEDVSFASYVHVVGWPGSVDGLTSRSVVLEGVHTANWATGSTLLANLHVENNADTTDAVITKAGNGVLRLFGTRVASNGADASQGPALALEGGTLDATRSTFLLNTTLGSSLVAFSQTGANSESSFDSCLFEGPSCLGVNSSLDLGVVCSVYNSRLTVAHASGRGVYTVAERLVLDKTNIALSSAIAVTVNPAAAVFAGDVTLDIRFSDLGSGNIRYDTTNLAGATNLLLGSVIYGDLVYPAAAPTQVATTKSKTHFYDNTVSGILADNVQDAIDVLSTAGTPAFSTVTYLRNIPEVPNDTVRYRGWAPVACELAAIRVYMQTPHTVGNYDLAVTNEATGNTVLLTNPTSLNAIGAATVTPVSLTAVPGDLSFAALDRWTISLTSDDPGFDGEAIYVELLFNAAVAGGPIVEDLATTLLVGNITGGTDIEVTAGDIVQLGDSPLAPVAPANTGGLRYNQASGSIQSSTDGGAWQDLITAVWNLVSTAGPAYTAANTEFVVVTGASTIVTLPAPVLNARVAVKAAVVPVDIQVRTSGVGILIDGTDYSAVGLPLTTQWEQVSFISDGSNWFIF